MFVEKFKVLRMHIAIPEKTTKLAVLATAASILSSESLWSSLEAARGSDIGSWCNWWIFFGLRQESCSLSYWSSSLVLNETVKSHAPRKWEGKVLVD